MLCDNPGRMCPPQVNTGSGGNSRLHAVDNFILPPLVSPTSMRGGGVFLMFFIGVILFGVIYAVPCIGYVSFCCSY